MVPGLLPDRSGLGRNVLRIDCGRSGRRIEPPSIRTTKRSHRLDDRPQSASKLLFQTVAPIRTLTSSVPRSVFIMMQPRSAISTNRSSSSRSRLPAATRNSTRANRAGESMRYPATSTRTSETSASRALIAASRLLMKQPPTEARKSSPPIGPASAPPFSAGLSISTR
jgi:hypothetical protein